MAPHDFTPLLYLGAYPLPLSLPVMGTRICAGFPSPADDFMDGDLDLSRYLAPNRPATFFWRVQGHSMVDAGIYNGDLVVVDRSVKPFDGCAVVAVIDGETSLKVYRTSPRPHLGFANTSFPLLVIDDAQDVAIWGVVTWTIHRPQKP